MAFRAAALAALASLYCPLLVAADTQACSIKVPSSLPSPVAAPGYAVRLVASGLKDPRGIKFDSAGHLLVVESGTGVASLTLQDDGGACVGVKSSKNVVADTSLNHGLELSVDGKTLFASSTAAVYSYPYAPTTSTAKTARRALIVTNMTNTDHVTRTLLISHKVPGTLLVSRGSTANIDPIAEQITSGHSQIRSFNLNTRGTAAYNYPSDGKLLGWGLRNDVGVAEHPISGGIYSVENSVDNMERNGVDIHDTNPGEELNFLGYLDGTHSANQGGNFGYPTCFSAWNISDIPDNKGITHGSQFSIGTATAATDAHCRNAFVAPRLVFNAHMAPLDIKFNKAGNTGFVTFHGSFDRPVPAGYKVCGIQFNAKSGDPIKPSSSTDACDMIASNQNPRSCSSGGNCFRPVGLALDQKGRVFFSSDATGEIYIITKADGTGF